MHSFKRYEQTAELMAEMMQQTGVDLAAHSAAALENELRQAVNNCIDCSATVQCRDWLAQGHENAAPPEFCANVGLFETLAARGA